MDAFEIAEQAQDTLAEVYALISRRFRDDADLRALFLLLAEEERRHAGAIKAMAKQWNEEGDVWQPTVAIDELVALMDRTESLLVVLIHRPITPVEALNLAASLEQDFADVHRVLFTSEDEPQLVELFEHLKKPQPGHAELMQRLAQGTTESSPAARKRRQTMSSPPSEESAEQA